MQIPNDHSRQVTPWYFVEVLLKQTPAVPFQEVLDLGCGEGNSVDLFRKARPGIRWRGLDIPDSLEARRRKRTDVEIDYYDGKAMPFPDNFFDLVYCRQVFEHVLFPREVLKEVNRVLRPGGHFVGSASQLEPFHSFSLWNYTPYGFSLLLEEAGFQVREFRPSTDALIWILRRMFRRPRFFYRWAEKESPLNRLIQLWGTLKKRTPAQINTLKLLYSYAFCFWAQKPAALPDSASPQT